MMITVASGFLVYFVSGAPLMEVIGLLFLGLLGGLVLITTSPYRKERLLTFLDPLRDPLGASYHIRQILIALGSGGLFGLGLGQSRQKWTRSTEVACPRWARTWFPCCQRRFGQPRADPKGSPYTLTPDRRKLPCEGTKPRLQAGQACYFHRSVSKNVVMLAPKM